jgi:enoyl-CoA hydratase/carnithine racemase
MFAALRSLPQPTIAAVHGFALGGGMEIALLCDWIVAAADAQFGLPEALLGIIPGGNGAINLPRLIGPNRAKELLFSGRRITADEAFALGIAQRVVSSEKLLEEARETALSFAAASPTSVRAIKRLANAALDVPHQDALLIEEECYQTVISSSDRVEGIEAFVAHRAPQWAGN